VTRRQEWGALGALVLVSVGFRAWAALEVPVPWITPDEMVYSLLGRGLYEHGSLEILGGPTPFYSFLTPVFAGLPLSVLDLATGYDVLHGLQALVMSLAAVPAYLWARTIVSRRSALVVAALTLAVPGLTYAGLVMTEVLFYPLLVLAAWAGAEAIARPTRRTQALLVVAVAAASATRLQAIALLPAFATAALLDAAIARSWRNLRSLVPAAAGLGALILVWLVWRLASGSAALGGYAEVAHTSYSAGAAARYVLYHLADLLVLCGVVPACAVALLLVRALRSGEPDPRVRAYLATAVSLSVWLVVEVGIFASRYSERIVERNLFGLAPVLFLGLLLWLERGFAGSYVERAAIALVAAVVLVAFPVDRFVNAYGTHDAMTLIPFYNLSTATSLDTVIRVFPSVAGAVAVAFAFLPGRALRAVPFVLLALLAAASVASSRFVVDQAQAQQRTLLGPDPRWIDHAMHERTVYLYDGEPSWSGVWETLFWNKRIDRVYDLSDYGVPGPLPQAHVQLQGDGTVFVPPSDRGEPGFAVASTSFVLDGERVAQIEQQGLKQAGLVLWKLDRPLRAVSRVSGLEVNGDIYAHTRASFVAYGCTRGTFRLTLIIKGPQTIDVLLDGKVIRRLDYPAPAPDEVWRGELPVAGHDGGACRFEVVSSGLLGTTVFTFDRG
jgi:Dolichyl-phosphate-mannose-protein mannosyltransferase